MVVERMLEPFWARIGRVLIRPLLFLILAGVMAFQGLQLWEPPEGRLGFMRRVLADRTCTQVAEDLPERASVATLAILRMPGDDTGLIHSLLSERIEGSGKYRLLEESFFRRLLAEFGREEAPVSRLSEAVATARQLGVDYVLFGQIPEFSAEERSATLRLELRMAERESGHAVFARSYVQRMGGSVLGATYWRARVADSSKGRRIFTWVLFTLLLPLLSVPLIRKLTASESNLVNLFMIIGYTTLDMLLALLLTGFWIPNMGTAVLLLVALVVSGGYNYMVASIIERMRQ